MNNSGPSQRQLRVGEQIRHMIAETLQRGHFGDPDLYDVAQTVTVSEVRVSPDLKNATAFVMTLGGQRMDTLLPALNNAAGYFQKEVARQLQTRYTPRLRFVPDNSFDEAAKIEEILKQLPKGNEG
jgi:ribosome-binding factor A